MSTTFSTAVGGNRPRSRSPGARSNEGQRNGASPGAITPTRGYTAAASPPSGARRVSNHSSATTTSRGTPNSKRSLTQMLTLTSKLIDTPTRSRVTPQPSATPGKTGARKFGVGSKAGSPGQRSTGSQNGKSPARNQSASPQSVDGWSEEAKALKKELASLLRFDPVKPQPTSVHPAPILPHVAIGSAAHATNVEWLLANRFTHVLNLAEGTVQACEETYEGSGIVYRGIASKDETNYPMLDFHYDECRDFLDEVDAKLGKCLVSCQAGVNRSGVITLAYFSSKRRDSSNVLNAAMYVKQQRGRVCTNETFQRQLIEFALRNNIPLL